MLSLEQARELILSRLQPLPSESVRTAAALGRFLRQSVAAAVDLPPFDNSAMDGYAVAAGTLQAASPENRVTLRVAGKVGAGQAYAGTLREGECIRIFTGSPLPSGADAVVMQEDVEATSTGSAIFHEPVRPFENVRLRGEDVRVGTSLGQPGQAVTIPLAGLLAACGVPELEVARSPRVALLSTGSELREAGTPLEPGQIYESNRTMLAGAVRQAGGTPGVLPLVPDTLKATTQALERALAGHDAVVTTGGVSVGEFDFVKTAIGQLGGRLDFWKVAIKPGKAFVFGHCQGKPIFGLPGNPVSALVTFLLLVRPALLQMQGAANLLLPAIHARLADRISNPGDRRHFVRVHAAANGTVRVAGQQASHRLGALGEANGLLDLPAGATLEAEETVEVLLWDLPGN